MDSALLDNMRARARDVRTRAAVRSWNYRQRNLAAGVWFRLRCALANAKAAYVISDEEAQRLMTEGYRPEPCGVEIVPPKTILFVDEPRLSRIHTRRPIPVDLGPEFLGASTIALIAFEPGRRRPRRRGGGPGVKALEATAFERGTAGRARVVRVPGAHHYVFISHEADVLQELRRFLSSLP